MNPSFEVIMTPFFEIIGKFEWEELDNKEVKIKHIVLEDETMTVAYDEQGNKAYILNTTKIDNKFTSSR